MNPDGYATLFMLYLMAQCQEIRIVFISIAESCLFVVIYLYAAVDKFFFNKNEY